jgi:UDP-3-O-[3-hydroxymyristoyl] glucosamine N-acyltransferase
LKASELAQAVAGRLEGGTDPEITGTAPLDRAGPSDLSLFSAAQYAADAARTAAGAVLVSPELAALCGTASRASSCPVHTARCRSCCRLLHPPEPPVAGVHPTAVIGEGADWARA